MAQFSHFLPISALNLQLCGQSIREINKNLLRIVQYLLDKFSSPMRKKVRYCFLPSKVYIYFIWKVSYKSNHWEIILSLILSVLFVCTVMTLSVAGFGQTISSYNYRRLQYWEHCQEVISPLETKPWYRCKFRQKDYNEKVSRDLFGVLSAFKNPQHSV